MTTATIEVDGHVQCTHLSDGMLVRLTGMLSDSQLPMLRTALLAPLADSCRDVVVDAGDVVGVDEPALAVLVAARVWAEQQGARFMLSRSAPALEQVLTENDCAGALPRLSTLPSADR